MNDDNPPENEALSEFLPDLLLEVNALDLRIINGNPPMADYLGSTPKDLAGSMMEPHAADTILGKCITKIPTAVETNRTQIFDEQNAGRFYHCIVVPVQNQFGGIVRLIIKDITEEKELFQLNELHNKQLKLLNTQLPVLFYTYDPGLGGIQYSIQSEFILGYKKEKLIENPMLWHDSIHPDDLAEVDSAIDSALEGRDIDLVYRIKTSGGSWRWFLDRAKTEPDIMGKELIFGVAVDITDQKETEKKLKTLVSQKEILMKELTIE